jgi:hypothetical protein
MGKRNSSITRVAPVFGRLSDGAVAPSSWLPTLLRLPSSGNDLCLPPRCDFTIQDARRGVNEKRLDRPVALLSWLIRHPRMSLGQLSSDPVKAQRRRELIDGMEARLIGGLALLRDNPERENWHIFEGPTQPDVIIQTPSVMVVIEGKSTEREPTTSTKWMPVRNQMLYDNARRAPKHSGLHELDVERDGDVVAHQNAAGLKRSAQAHCADAD